MYIHLNHHNFEKSIAPKCEFSALISSKRFMADFFGTFTYDINLDMETNEVRFLLASLLLRSF